MTINEPTWSKMLRTFSPEEADEVLEASFGCGYPDGKEKHHYVASGDLRPTLAAKIEALQSEQQSGT